MDEDQDNHVTRKLKYFSLCSNDQKADVCTVCVADRSVYAVHWQSNSLWTFNRVPKMELRYKGNLFWLSSSVTYFSEHLPSPCSSQRGLNPVLVVYD